MKKIIMGMLVLTMIFSCKQAKKVELATNTVDSTWLKKAVIYEVNVRQYTKEGTFKAFSTHLERLKSLGVDILWIMPINPIGEKNRKAPLGSYYSVKDYSTVNPEFGTMDDFKDIVNKAHELGMKAILDWVANHTSCDHAWLKEHPDFYKKDKTGKIISPYDWTDTYQLDYTNKAMRQEMVKSMKFWLTEAKIDGFRCDVAGLVPNDFWEAAVNELKQTKPDIFMLAEAENAGSCKKAFKMEYTWDFFNITKEIAKGKKDVSDIAKYLQKLDTGFNKNAYKMYFTSNHDENSWNGTPYELYADGHKAYYTLMVVMPGMPLIYGGQERGLNKRLKFFEKDQINWAQDTVLEAFYKEIISVKKQNQALWNGNDGGKLELIDVKSKFVFAGKRVSGDNKIVAIINLSKTTQTINTEDLKLDESKIIFKSGNWNNSKIEPFGYFIFKL